MPSLIEKFDMPTLFSSSCNSTDNRFSRWIDKSEGYQVQLPCDPKPENIITCKNAELDTYLEEIDGLDFFTVSARPITIELPQFIPVIDRSFFNYPSGVVDGKIIGVSLEDIFHHLYTHVIMFYKIQYLKTKKYFF